MTSEELYRWMAENDVKPKEMAERLGIPSKTLSAYKSKGLPSNKSILAEKVTAEWFQEKEGKIIPLPKNEFVLTPESEAQRDSWVEAGFLKGKDSTEFTEHTYHTLDKVARAYLSASENMAAEDPAKYQTKKESNGSGT